jgi:hypothetical protein
MTGGRPVIVSPEVGLIGEGDTMDFIERWFGLFPDGGNGSLEALYLCTVLGAIVAARLYRDRRTPARVTVFAQPTDVAHRDPN